MAKKDKELLLRKNIPNMTGPRSKKKLKIC